MQATEKKMGKKLYVLNSYVRKDGKDIQDGYLLFQSPEKAESIIEVCEAALNDTSRKLTDQGQAFYKHNKWIIATDFYGNQVAQRGSMFVRKLEEAELDVGQSNIENWEEQSNVEDLIDSSDEEANEDTEN